MDPSWDMVWYDVSRFTNSLWYTQPSRPGRTREDGNLVPCKMVTSWATQKPTQKSLVWTSRYLFFDTIKSIKQSKHSKAVVKISSPYMVFELFVYAPRILFAHSRATSCTRWNSWASPPKSGCRSRARSRYAWRGQCAMWIWPARLPLNHNESQSHDGSMVLVYMLT